MSDYLISQQLSDGKNMIYAAGQGPLDLLSFSIVKLAAGESHDDNTQDEEYGLVILSGLLSLEINGEQHNELGGRTSVFAGQATGVYLPPGTAWSVQADSRCELAVCSTPSDSSGPPQIIRPDEVQVNHAGNWNWRRQVHNIIGANVPQAQRLLVGETFNPPGNWSSYPPHKHEEDDYPFQINMQELYHFRMNPPQGFGIQCIYSDDLSLDETCTVRNTDTVIIPNGYHPVVAAPGYQLYYLWMMAGVTDRRMAPQDDPNHAWVKATGTMAKDMGF
ncbi:MAG: 5-deoxy-glucuronate isomerase [Armatimonadetes bacterium]|nr:5-deoxy-glucuronate isomerase [Armatimonadota bacterium]